MKEYGSYVFMLVYVDNDWLDIGGNEYPTEGYVEANNFTNDIDIQNGLYGIMWGKTFYLPYEKIDQGHWIVVKTETNEELIKTDWYYNRYKFKYGAVVYAGNIRSAAKYIIKNKDNLAESLTEDAQWLQPEEIAGSKEWLKEYNLGVENYYFHR